MFLSIYATHVVTYACSAASRQYMCCSAAFTASWMLHSLFLLFVLLLMQIAEADCACQLRVGGKALELRSLTACEGLPELQALCCHFSRLPVRLPSMRAFSRLLIIIEGLATCPGVPNARR